MTTYKELIKQRDSLEQEIALARKRELAQAIAQVHELIGEFGLTQQDIFPVAKSGAVKAAKKTGNKVAAKYRNPATGDTWTGRGKAPKWIAGKDRAPFTI